MAAAAEAQIKNDSDGGGAIGRRDPGAERGGTSSAGDDERGEPAPGLPPVPRQGSSANACAHERRESVAKGHDAPRGGNDVEPRPEQQDQREDRKRIEQDAGPRAAKLCRPDDARRDPGEEEEIEDHRTRGEERGLRPREHPQQQRERRHRDVDQLPAGF